MDGGVVGGCCSAAGEGSRDDAVVDLFGAAERIWWCGRGVCGCGCGCGWVVSVHWRVGVAERGFEGEGVGFEPVKEGGLAEDASVGVLGGVDVGVWLRVRRDVIYIK